MTESTPEPRAAEPAFEIPEGVRRSKAALRRDLAKLLASHRGRSKWVCYHLDEFIGVGTSIALLDECLRRNFRDDEYVIEHLDLWAGLEEIDYDNGPPPLPT